MKELRRKFTQANLDADNYARRKGEGLSMLLHVPGARPSSFVPINGLEDIPRLCLNLNRTLFLSSG